MLASKGNALINLGQEHRCYLGNVITTNAVLKIRQQTSQLVSSWGVLYQLLCPQ